MLCITMLLNILIRLTRNNNHLSSHEKSIIKKKKKKENTKIWRTRPKFIY